LLLKEFEQAQELGATMEVAVRPVWGLLDWQERLPLEAAQLLG